MIEVTSEYLSAQGLSPTFPQRFWEKVIKPDNPSGCWIFNAHKNRRGYGRVGRGWHRGGVIFSHRASWILTRGPIPEGLCCLHLCDNPSCVNPDHLWIGTREDNNRDMKNKNRHAFGERVGGSKLNSKQVNHIRACYAFGTVSQQRLANLYGVTQSRISSIVNFTSWVPRQ